MSNRTTGNKSKNTKRSARERMRAERERQEKRAKVRRQLTVAGAVVAVVATAAGIGVAVASSSAGGSGSPAAGSGKPLVVPAGASGKGGTTIVYGDRKAEDTLEIYEDPRCPFCAKFEAADGATVKKLADQGRLKAEYHLATFLDGKLGGSGSQAAVSALGAALDQGVDKFLAFHTVLYANQPEETADTFSDTGRLLELAGKVPGLKSAAFTKAVKQGTFAPWARKVGDAFTRSPGINGTPTVKLDGTTLPVLDNKGEAISAQKFTALVDKGLGKRK